ncbi:MAG: TIR domain-containing protein [Mesorhizobium sp.]|nr:MAG: TIR domain-containing protein [Mesorhizobium sp.]
MKIFASWSGKQSHSIAQALKEWLPSVLQSVDVFVSSRDIASGDRGLNAIASSLAERGFGIVILTKSNLKAPWVLFEAGALSNTLPGRVTPLLCDLPELALAGSPLSQFQFNNFDQAGVLKLVKDINKVSAAPIDEQRLDITFEKFWPDLEKAYSAIPPDEDAPKNEPPEAARIATALTQVISEQVRLASTQDEIRDLLIRSEERATRERLNAIKLDKALGEAIGRFGINNNMAPPGKPFSPIFEAPTDSPPARKKGITAPTRKRAKY